MCVPLLSSQPDVPAVATRRSHAEPELTEVGRGWWEWSRAPAAPRSPVCAAGSQPLDRPHGVSPYAFAVFLSVSSLHRVYLTPVFLLRLSFCCSALPLLILHLYGGGFRSAAIRVHCFMQWTENWKHWVAHTLFAVHTQHVWRLSITSLLLITTELFYAQEFYALQLFANKVYFSEFQFCICNYNYNIFTIL